MLESLECRMIHEVRRKIAKELNLSLSERAREESALPTDLWKKPVSLKNDEISTACSGGSRISPSWGHQPSGGGAPTYDFAKFSPKLHEIKRIWTGGAFKISLCRSATGLFIC